MLAGLNEFSPSDRVFILVTGAVILMGVLAFAFAFAAILLRVANDRKAARLRALEESWRPDVLAATLSPTADATALIARIEPKNALFFVDYLMRYVRQVRGEERTRAAALARTFLPGIEGRLHDLDPKRRARAVHTLGLLGAPAYGDEIVAALDDASPLVCMIAARALARPEYGARADAVVAHLHRFDAWSLNFLAALVACIGPAAAAALRRTLADAAAVPRVRAVAAHSLRYLRDPGAADDAARILSVESDLDLRSACLELIHSFGRPEHLEAVRPFCDSPDEVLKSHAIGVLGRLGGPEDVKILVGALGSPSTWIALRAARALKERGAVQPLQRLAASSDARAGLAQEVLAETRAP